MLQASDVAAMMQPNTPISGSPFPEFGFGSYGMGLFVNTYRGIEYASHGGNMPGAAAVVLMVPKEKIGVVVLTNRSGARLRDGLPFEIVDRLLGLPSAGMVARYGELEQKALAGEEAAKAGGVSDQRKGTAPAHALADYAADYAHPGYGTVAHRATTDGRLQLAYNGFKTPLDHWHYEVFRAPDDRANRLEQTRVRFETDLEGEVSTIEVPMEPNVAPTVFTRKAPAEMTTPAFLAPLVGVYEVNGIDAEVVLREDGVLLYVVLGRARELVPVRGHAVPRQGPDGRLGRVPEGRRRAASTGSRCTATAARSGRARSSDNMARTCPTGSSGWRASWCSRASAPTGRPSARSRRRRSRGSSASASSGRAATTWSARSCCSATRTRSAPASRTWPGASGTASS